MTLILPSRSPDAAQASVQVTDESQATQADNIESIAGANTAVTPVQMQRDRARSAGGRLHLAPALDARVAPLDGVATGLRVEVDGIAFTATANQEGVFPRIFLAPSETLRAAITFPPGRARAPLVIRVLDGGTLAEGGAPALGVASQTLDDTGAASFRFTAADQTGLYRLALQTDEIERTVELWVGPESPLRAQ